MPSWFDDSPFPIAFAVLFGIVFLRAQGTYWIGRAVTAGLLHTRVATWMTSPRMTRAVDAPHRWGLPLVTVSFLTVGFQTVVNAAAGLIRMPWLRYTIAMLIGCAAWAAIYATVGIAAFEASLALAARSPWALVGVIAVLLGVLVAVVVMRARSHRREQGGKQGRDDGAEIQTDLRADAESDAGTDAGTDTAAVAGHADGRDHRDPPTRLHGGGFA